MKSTDITVLPEWATQTINSLKEENRQLRDKLLSASAINEYLTGFDIYLLSDPNNDEPEFYVKNLNGEMDRVAKLRNIDIMLFGKKK